MADPYKQPCTIDHIPVDAKGRVTLSLDDFITQTYAKNRAIVWFDSNHGEPAIPNLLARTTKASVAAGAKKDFIEFPRNYQPQLKAYLDSGKNSDQEKGALKDLMQTYNARFNPAPLPISRPRCIEEYEGLFKACKAEGMQPHFMDTNSFGDLVIKARELKESMDAVGKEVAALEKNDPKYKAKQKELEEKQEIYKLFENILPIQDEVMKLQAKKAVKQIADQEFNKRMGELGDQARHEAEKAWVQLMKEEMKADPNMKFRATAGRSHGEGDDLDEDIARRITGDKGTVTVLVAQAPVLRDTIRTGKKENLPFLASRDPKDLPEFVVVVPSVLLLDELKKDTHYQNLPQKRKDELAERYEEAGNHMSGLMHHVSDKLLAISIREKDPAKAARESAPYNRLEGNLYMSVYLELSRGQIADARASASDMRAWVEQEGTLEKGEKEKLLSHLKGLEKTLEEVNGDIKGAPTPNNYHPMRLMPTKPASDKEEKKQPDAPPMALLPAALNSIAANTPEFAHVGLQAALPRNLHNLRGLPQTHI